MAGPSRVLIGVGGGVAAFKAATLVSQLAQRGFHVQVAMTTAATKFIGAATFTALSGRATAIDMFQQDRWPLGPHIELAEGVDLYCVLPATADLLAKFANGNADCLVSTLFLQVQSPVLLAPAMSNAMWSKPSVQRNVQRLSDDGVHFVGPDSGWLSCRQTGAGRMAEPQEIASRIETLLGG